MRLKAVLLAFAILILGAVPAFSQRSARTVTNVDLEKYRQQRLRAEKDYAENYERMGFPSPEELQKQIEKSRAEREALATRLVAERLQREHAEAEFAAATARAARETVFMMPGREAAYYFFPNLYPYPGRYRGPVRGGNGQPIFDYFNTANTERKFPSFRVSRP